MDLKQSDADILYKINDIIKNERPIAFRSRYDKRTNKTYDQASLKILSDKIVNDLINLGMGFRKSFDLKYPSFIDQNLQSHFMRGLFDGDGCIFINNERSATWNICGTPEICNGVQEQLSNININSRVVNRPYFSGPHSSVIVGDLEEIEKIFKYLYEDSENLYLIRKYDKFSELNFDKMHIRQKLLKDIELLILSGIHKNEICKRLNCNISTINLVVKDKKLIISSPPPKNKKIKIKIIKKLKYEHLYEKIFELSNNEKTPYEIRDELKIPLHVIYTLLANKRAA